MPEKFQKVNFMDATKKDNKNAALWSFIIGLVSILLGPLLIIVWPFLIVIASLGLSLGIKGLKSSRRKLSIAGIVLCGFDLIWLVVIALLGVVLMILSSVFHSTIL